MTNVRYFLMLHFHRVKTQIDHFQPLESSNYPFEPSKNNVLSSLRPMDKNPRRHEQVLEREFQGCTIFSLLKMVQVHSIFVCNFLVKVTKNKKNQLSRFFFYFLYKKSSICMKIFIWSLWPKMKKTTCLWFHNYSKFL